MPQVSAPSLNKSQAPVSTQSLKNRQVAESRDALIHALGHHKLVQFQYLTKDGVLRERFGFVYQLVEGRVDVNDVIRGGLRASLIQNIQGEVRVYAAMTAHDLLKITADFSRYPWAHDTRGN